MKVGSQIAALVAVALTAMAFVGISSATAENTSLCSADGSECGVEHVHEVSTTKAKLLTGSSGSSLTIECDVLFLGDALSSEGNPLVIHGNFTYTSCACTPFEKCLGCTPEVYEESEEGYSEITVLKEGHETAKVTG